MADTVDKKTRSRIMSSVQGKNTQPEKVVRSLLHRMGYRFSLHNKHLPGKPDICLRKYKTVIFVHGCFWHRHKGCRYATTPSSNVSFWNEKFERNVSRDAQNRKDLKKLGWQIIIVWGCSIKSIEKLSKRFDQLLSNKI